MYNTTNFKPILNQATDFHETCNEYNTTKTLVFLHSSLSTAPKMRVLLRWKHHYRKCSIVKLCIMFPSNNTRHLLRRELKLGQFSRTTASSTLCVPLKPSTLKVECFKCITTVYDTMQNKDTQTGRKLSIWHRLLANNLRWVRDISVETEHKNTSKRSLAYILRNTWPITYNRARWFKRHHVAFEFLRWNWLRPPEDGVIKSKHVGALTL